MDDASKVVLVTGSSRGIGAAIALLFAKHGASLSLTGRNAEKLSEVAKKCKENGAKQVLETIADVTKEEELDRLVEQTIKTFGKLDVLVNNAGILILGNLEAYTSESFDALMSTNVKAPMYLMKIAKSHLAATKGNIVNISSIGAFYNNSTALVYSMTKLCMNYITKSCVKDLSKDGIRINAICPGPISTEIFDNSFTNEEKQGILEKYASSLKGRVPTVEEAADLVYFLASDKASMVTGECMPFDGGVFVSSTT